MSDLSKVELLAPAGDREKLETALYFGADAVYLGGKQFSLRTFADNFTYDGLQEAIKFAHGLQKKVYVTANVFAKNADFAAMEDYFPFLQSIGVDGVIVSDPGVVYLVKKCAPKLAIHLSTQANTTNAYSVRFWAEQGVSRVILARELSIKEIATIHEFTPEVELEAFVHGAMCISYSGRCLLSDYLDGRSSNRGACVQACRWKYEVRAFDTSGKTGEWMSVEEDGKGTYIFNSKDLNMLSHLHDLQGAGISSFKIEGRMKSPYYLATVIGAYRRFMDGGDEKTCRQELENIAHREYTTAYALGGNRETVHYIDSQSKGERVYIGNVLSYADGYAEVEMRNRFRQGDSLEILSPDKNHAKSFTAEKIIAPDESLVEDAKLVQTVYRVSCPYPVKKGDFVRKKV